MTHSLKIDSIKELCIINKKVFCTFGIKFKHKLIKKIRNKARLRLFFEKNSPLHFIAL